MRYFGFNIFNTILAGDALHTTVGGSAKPWIVAATVLADDHRRPASWPPKKTR